MDMEKQMERDRLFWEMDNHLLADKYPSLYFQSLQGPVFDAAHPFTMLSRLKTVEQEPQHHPEGNVWNHTLLVLDEAAKRRSRAGDARVFMWAALLHDIGKAVTTKVRRGKITAYGHDRAGGEMVKEFLAPFEKDPFIRRVARLVGWHMQILYVTKGLPFARPEEMRSEAEVEEIALLGLCDRLGRLGADRRKEEAAVAEFKRRVLGNQKQ